MKIERFEDIVAWQKSKELSLSIYKIFRVNKDLGFRDQICKASISVMNNIAEGFERKSDNEFRHFLYISKGSCGEIRSMLHIAIQLNYLTTEQYRDMEQLSSEVSKLISGLIKSLK
jgi:four helix bundle protein